MGGRVFIVTGEIMKMFEINSEYSKSLGSFINKLSTLNLDYELIFNLKIYHDNIKRNTWDAEEDRKKEIVYINLNINKSDLEE